MEFSTFDNDNDIWRGVNCAADYRGDGGNWWKNCGGNNINGIYGSDGDIKYKFMYWYGFDKNDMALKSMSLMFRQVG